MIRNQKSKRGRKTDTGMYSDTAKTCYTGRRGVALLVVLFIVMVITITSLGFLSRSNVELACGQNMKLRTEMDYLAESGLEHARGLTISPQDISSEYWTGAVGQQIAGGDDYYDVRVVREDSDPTDRCNYIIDCNAYRLRNGEQVGRSNIRAQLRLDPCIAYWAGSTTTISQQVMVNGDVYCAGDLTNCGSIRGDVFAGGTITGAGIDGRANQSVTQAPIDWPGVEAGDFYPTYYIGTTVYSAENVSSDYLSMVTFQPSAGNPAGVRIRDSLSLGGDVDIEGTLVVPTSLGISGTNNVITAVKNFPALVVGGDLRIYTGALEINGLAVVKGRVLIGSNNASLNVVGGLFVEGGIAELAMDASGSFYNGTLHNGPIWRPAGGQIGGALEFDGVDDYVQTDDSSSELQLTGDYTLSVWIKPDASQKTWAGIFSKCSPDGSTNHWTLQFDSSSPRRLVIHHPDYLPAPCSWDTGITLTEIAGTWHHIGVVRSGNQMIAYLDGNARNLGAWTNAPGSGNGHFNIGADRIGSSSYVYKGLIDNICIYDNALDANDIYPPKGGLGGLIGNWRLDEVGSNVTITAAPCKTAITLWPSPGVTDKWQQVGGAFFRSIERK